MKKLILIVLTLLFCMTSLSAGELKKYELKHDGIYREYSMYMPEGIQKNASLVFIFHGYGGCPDYVSHYLMNQSDKYKFALCLPQGTKDPQGTPCWNLYYDSQKGMKTDDISFIEPYCTKEI